MVNQENRQYLPLEEYLTTPKSKKIFETWYKNTYNDGIREKVAEFDFVQKDENEDYKEDKLQDLLKKYENKEIKGDFLMFELYFYDIMDPT